MKWVVFLAALLAIGVPAAAQAQDRVAILTQWSGGKASIRWIDINGVSEGRYCGAKAAHGFYQKDGPAISALIGFIKAR